MQYLPSGTHHDTAFFFIIIMLCLSLLAPFAPAAQAHILADSKTLVTVTTSADTADGTTTSFAALNAAPGADKAISLREALLAANASAPDTDLTIAFNIPASDSGRSGGVWTLALNTAKGALPPLNRGRVTIDGTTQPGGAAAPAIVLDGKDSSVFGSGLTITSAQNTVRGLAVQHFYDEGILIAAASDNRVIASVLRENGDDGLLITDGSHNTQVIGTSVLNNYAAGIELRGGPTQTRIGGNLPEQRNIISGNGYAGVLVADTATTNTVIAGNLIGVTADGAHALANAVAGVRLVDSRQTLIGGTAAGAGNIIAGNEVGISIEQSDNNTVAGNTIGLAADGSTIIGNDNGGIFVRNGASNNLIGGTTPAARNIIAGNGSATSGYGQGIYITDAGTSNNLVQGNYIGMTVNDANESVARSNTSYGVQISFNASSNIIGGTEAGSGNVIAANRLGGVRIDSASNQVAGNLIGTGADGTTALPNLNNGVRVRGNNNIIGPSNTIAFQPLSGVIITGQNAQVISNTVSMNDRSGVCIIGADAVVARNLVSRNGSSTGPWTECTNRGGITVEQASRAAVSANTVESNQGAGITVQGGTSNQLQENSISNNAAQGIALVGGGNNGIAAPVITKTTATDISGTSCASCRVEVYADPSNQGQYFVGSISARTDGIFVIAIAPGTVRAQNLTATQTDASGNTSSFAMPVTFNDEPASTPTVASAPTRYVVLLPLMQR